MSYEAITLLNVHIGVKHYIYRPDTDEVFVCIKENYIEKRNNHLRAAHSRMIKKTSPIFKEVKSLALQMQKIHNL